MTLDESLKPIELKKIEPPNGRQNVNFFDWWNYIYDEVQKSKGLE